MNQESAKKFRILIAITTLCAFGLRIQATPYATCLTNDGTGTISFRLNQTIATNDTVLVVSGGGTVTNALLLPANDPANVIARGLIVTNLGVAAGTFQIYIKHTGSGVISTNSPRIAYNSPRGVAVNTHPASPYFGWVYVGNSASGSKGDGMFIHTADLADPTGQGVTALTGGYNFGTGGASAPYHCSIAPDDSVLVTDWSDASGNLIMMPPLLDSYSYVLKQFEGTAAAPVGANNNHGSIISAFIVGSGANRVLYTADEDYQTDPTSGSATEWNSVWRYDIGDGPLPWSNAPNRKLMSPYLIGFAGQNGKVEVFGHHLYSNQRRANPPQHDVYVVDLDNLQDPGTYTGATPWGTVWNSQDESLAEGYVDDVLRDTMTTSVSPDGKWFAAIIAGGNTPAGTAANDVIVCPLTNGIPHLAARQVFRMGGAGLGRDIAFDAAHNLYFVSSGLAVLQSLDIGESTEATTGSDGTFSLLTPATQVSVAATTPIANEQGATPGVITITRTPEDIGNPVTVFYELTGTAGNGVDYVSTTNRVVIAAGATSTNIVITPIDDGDTELTETAVLTIKGSGGYSVGFPLSATVYIADNETPQLRIQSLSTNVYQGVTNDYAALSIRRWGNTNVDVTVNASDLAFGGTAVKDVDFYLANVPFTIPAGVVDYTTRLIYPLQNSTAVGTLSILLTINAGSGYVVSNNTASVTLTLKGQTPGPILFSDDFENDPVGNNWKVIFASFTNNVPDYNVVFDYNYAAGGGPYGILPPIPAAPNSTNGDTKGLLLTVNKGDSYAIAAGLNLYLKNHAFSNDYALRFDMFLFRNYGSTLQSRIEYAIFGINHDGNHTNWFRNAVSGTDLRETPPPTAPDGLWFDVASDDESGEYDFGAWTSPAWTNGAGVIGPTNLTYVTASSKRHIFKSPPYDAGPTLGGVPANTVLSTTPTWATVEVSQVGNQIIWKINNTVVLSYAKTAATPYDGGTIMLGYNDGWDDIGNGSPSSGEGSVIYDNVRVVALASSPLVTPVVNAGNFSVSFPSRSGFKYVLERRDSLSGGSWTPVSTNDGTGLTITVPDGAADQPERYYRVRVQ